MSPILKVGLQGGKKYAKLLPCPEILLILGRIKLCCGAYFETDHRLWESRGKIRQ